MKSYLKFFLLFLLLIASYLGLDGFCSHFTHGFRSYFILSDLPNDSRWDTPPLSLQEIEKIRHQLNQPFTFLGSGGWCYAFLGADQTTVLKFYKHTHLTAKEIFKHFSFDKLLLRSASRSEQNTYFQELNFKSCMLLYNQMPERTGLIHVHLNKTQGLYPPVTLIDAIGVKHTIQLDQTEFLIQQRADLIIPHIDTLMTQGQVDVAKQCIEDILALLVDMTQKGIRDTDSSFRRNFGYIDNRAVVIDLSSFVEDPSLLEGHQALQEVRQKTKRLSHYLHKYQPQLYTHYQNLLKQTEIELLHHTH